MTVSDGNFMVLNFTIVGKTLEYHVIAIVVFSCKRFMENKMK